MTFPARIKWCAAVLLVAVVSGCSTEQPETLPLSELRPPVVPVLTESQLEAQAQADRARFESDLLRAVPEAVVPLVARVEFVEPEALIGVLAECLNEQGFEVVVDGDALIAEGVEGEQDKYQLALYACSVSYPVHPRYSVPLNDDQLRYLYEYYAHVAKPCVQALGFSVADVPGLDVFRAQYDSADGWNVYAGAADEATESEWATLNEKCPQTPAGLYG